MQNILEYFVQGFSEYHKEGTTTKTITNQPKQAGAELGQAQLKLGLGFTSTIDSM